jgi:hypothetical protein
MHWLAAEVRRVAQCVVQQQGPYIVAQGPDRHAGAHMLEAAQGCGHGQVGNHVPDVAHAVVVDWGHQDVVQRRKGSVSCIAWGTRLKGVTVCARAPGKL